MSYSIIGGTNVRVGQMSGGTNIGRTNVGGTNVCGTKVAPPYQRLIGIRFHQISSDFIGPI